MKYFLGIPQSDNKLELPFFQLKSYEHCIQAKRFIIENKIQELTFKGTKSNRSMLTNMFKFKFDILDQLLRIPSITNLDFGNNEISDEEAEIIAKALPYSCVRTLDLSNHTMGSKGIKSLTDFLPKSCVTTLSLIGTAIKEEGIRYIAEMLPNSSITTLKLGGRVIEQGCFKFLATAIPSSQVARLDINGNLLYLNDIQLLAEILPKSCITRLDISLIHITDKGVQILIEPLKNSLVIILLYTKVGSHLMHGLLPESEITDDKIMHDATCQNMKKIVNTLNMICKSTSNSELFKDESKQNALTKSANKQESDNLTCSIVEPSLDMDKLIDLVSILHNSSEDLERYIQLPLKLPLQLHSDNIEETVAQFLNCHLMWTQSTQQEYLYLINKCTARKLNKIVEVLLCARKNYIFPDDPNGETMDQLLIKEYNKLLSAHNMPPIGYDKDWKDNYYRDNNDVTMDMDQLVDVIGDNCSE